MKNGKKRRWNNPRISESSEQIALDMLENMYQGGLFDEHGRLIYPVLYNTFLHKCTNYRRRSRPRTEEKFEIGPGKYFTYVNKACTIETGADTITRHLSEIYTEHNVRFAPGDKERSKQIKNNITPKRWRDLSPRMQAAMCLYALKYQGIPHVQLTVFVGQELQQRALSSGEPLSAILLKKLREGLKPVLGDVEFGVWFHLEKDPDSGDIHIHGFLYIEEPGWLVENTTKNERLREVMRALTGDDGSKGNNWNSIPENVMDFGWVDYCRKSLRKSKYALPEAFGTKLDATSHCLSRIGKDFYERIRPFLIACLTNEVLDWQGDRFEEFGTSWDEDILLLD